MLSANHLDQYTTSSKSDVENFETGSPPDAPTNLYLIACGNTAARFGLDSFVEHQAEVKIIRVQCEPKSAENLVKEAIVYIPPNETDFEISELTERTDYIVTVYGITEEYLTEQRCREYHHLPKKLKSSVWLPNKAVEFQTSGYESVEQLNIRSATTESMQVEWALPKVYGSTRLVRQILQWKLEHGPENQRELNPNLTSAVISGPLPSGLYKVSLESIFSVQVNLEDTNDQSNRKEEPATITESVTIRFQAPGLSERPELYLTGYTTKTIDLTWNKPNLFSIVDHPEKTNEQLKLHRRLVDYRVDINGKKYNTVDEDQNRCTLTECNAGEKYDVQLITRTVVQNEYIHDIVNPRFLHSIL